MFLVFFFFPHVFAVGEEEGSSSCCQTTSAPGDGEWSFDDTVEIPTRERATWHAPSLSTLHHVLHPSLVHPRPKPRSHVNQQVLWPSPAHPAPISVTSECQWVLGPSAGQPTPRTSPQASRRVLYFSSPVCLQTRLSHSAVRAVA